MTTVVEALNRASMQCGVSTPSSWVTTARTDHKEIRDVFLPQTVNDILTRVDPPSPIGAQTTITGDGSTNYALPSDFKRLAQDALAVYDTAQDRPCIPVNTDGEWTALTDLGAAGVARYYRVKGYAGNYTIDLYNPPSTGIDITVSYVTTKWLVSSGGTMGDTFSADDDILLLDWPLLEAGIVWRFRERRGLQYVDKYNEYEALIARASNDGRRRQTINMSGDRQDVRWQDLIPAFIPSS